MAQVHSVRIAPLATPSEAPLMMLSQPKSLSVWRSIASDVPASHPGARCGALLASVSVARDDQHGAPASSLEHRATGGDQDALARLLREHAPALVRFATTLVAHRDAADMTQRALERIVKNIGRFDPQRGRFKTWAMAITRNVCIDHLRKRQELLSQTETQPDPQDLGPQADPSRALENKENIVELQRALQTLPEEMRSALTLFHVHGESYDDIATILDVPKGTVMTWLHRGRKRLKEQLEDRL